MDSSLRTIALANRSGQIEGPIFAQQKGNKLTLRAGRGTGRSVDAAWPLFGRRHFASQSWPPLCSSPFPPCPSPPPIAFPFQPAARARPLHHPRPCCALSVSPFRSLPATISVSRLIKRRKLANEISIRNTLIGVVSPYPYSSRRSANIPVPGFVVVCSLPLTWLKFDLRIVEKLQECFSYDTINLAPGLTVLDRMPRIMRARIYRRDRTSPLRIIPSLPIYLWRGNLE